MLSQLKKWKMRYEHSRYKLWNWPVRYQHCKRPTDRIFNRMPGKRIGPIKFNLSPNRGVVIVDTRSPWALHHVWFKRPFWRYRS